MHEPPVLALKRRAEVVALVREQWDAEVIAEHREGLQDRSTELTHELPPAYAPDENAPTRSPHWRGGPAHDQAQLGPTSGRHAQIALKGELRGLQAAPEIHLRAARLATNTALEDVGEQVRRDNLQFAPTPHGRLVAQFEPGQHAPDLCGQGSMYEPLPASSCGPAECAASCFTHRWPPPP